MKLIITKENDSQAWEVDDDLIDLIRYLYSNEDPEDRDYLFFIVEDILIYYSKKGRAKRLPKSIDFVSLDFNDSDC